MTWPIYTLKFRLYISRKILLWNHSKSRSKFKQLKQETSNRQAQNWQTKECYQVYFPMTLNVNQICFAFSILSVFSARSHKIAIVGSPNLKASRSFLTNYIAPFLSPSVPWSLLISGNIQSYQQEITWVSCIWTPEPSLHLISPFNWISTENWLRWLYTVGWAISSESVAERSEAKKDPRNCVRFFETMPRIFCSLNEFP